MTTTYTDQEIYDSIREGIFEIASGARVTRVKSSNGREAEYQAADLPTLEKLEKFYGSKVAAENGRVRNLAHFRS